MEQLLSVAHRHLAAASKQDQRGLVRERHSVHTAPDLSLLKILFFVVVVVVHVLIEMSTV